MRAINGGVRGLCFVVMLVAGCGKVVSSQPDADTTSDTFTVGGTVMGLSGTGLVLQNNGGDDLSVSGSGDVDFTFATPVAAGSGYSVTIATQPTNQTCTVSGGTGTVVSGNVVSVAVDCVSNTYTVGGQVNNLDGTGLVLQDNGGMNLPISANGMFAFPIGLDTGAAYSVTVLTNPQSNSQTCTVRAGTGSGNVGTSNVTSVQVDCVTNTFLITGTATGLQGSGLVLRNNGIEQIGVTANGGADVGFSFSTPIASGQTYAVDTLTDPDGPSQACVVSNASGTVGNGDVTDVVATCTTRSFLVKGNITGLQGGTVVLQDNGGDDLVRTTDGPFQFNTAVLSGQTFSVTVSQQPANRFCVVNAGSGTITNQDILGVDVQCFNGVTFSQSFVGGVVPSTQCTAWTDFAAQINPAATYSSITISGSNDVTGRTCTGAVANQLCQAIGTNTQVNPVACNGTNWSYGGGGCLPYRELDADQVCNCNSTYVVRACISTVQWGAVNGVPNSSASCGPASQTITVTCAF